MSPTSIGDGKLCYWQGELLKMHSFRSLQKSCFDIICSKVYKVYIVYNDLWTGLYKYRFIIYNAHG